MKTSLDCIPCFIRQAMETARMLSQDPDVHERIVRDVLCLASELDFDLSPPAMAQRIHHRLREITGIEDPFLQAKKNQNQMAVALLPMLKRRIQSASDPLTTAARMAIAGNIIDMGVNGNITASGVRKSLQQVMTETFTGDREAFRKAVNEAENILYLADNAGEIAIDRLLIEQLSPAKVTLAVRGGPAINDATMIDALAVGMDELVEIIDNGSDAPGTLLDDCSDKFLERYNEADLIIAKGQGNFESLSDEPRNIFFLFKVKCSVIASHAGRAVGTHVLLEPCDGTVDVSEPAFFNAVRPRLYSTIERMG